MSFGLGFLKQAGYSVPGQTPIVFQGFTLSFSVSLYHVLFEVPFLQARPCSKERDICTRQIARRERDPT